MHEYPATAVERAMKVQEVILRAMSKQITWYQAAEIIGISDRSMRRWRMPRHKSAAGSTGYRSVTSTFQFWVEIDLRNDIWT